MQGDSGVQYNLGNMYKRGHGVEQNDTKAVTWYKKAKEEKKSSLIEGENESCFSPNNFIETGETKFVQDLIKAGADVKAIDNDGKSLLHWASRTGNTAIAKLLGG